MNHAAKHWVCGAALFSTWLGAPPAAQSGEIRSIAVLKASDVPGGYLNGFGSSVGISGDYIVVGAPLDPYITGLNIGAIYVFRRMGPNWLEEVKLTPATEMWDGLGEDVAIDGDVLVAGAPHAIPGELDHGGPGAVYVFRRDDNGTTNDPWDDVWRQEAKLESPIGLVDRSFGVRVAIQSDVIAASYFFADKVEIFRWNPVPMKGWTHEVTLAGTPGEGFGASIDLDGNRIAIGAPSYDDRRGRAYVFVHDGTKWVDEGQVHGDDPARLDDFGWCVSLSGEHVIVGAPLDDDTATNAGAAYIFERDHAGTWVRQARLGVEDSGYLEKYGKWVAMEGDIAAASKAGIPPAWTYRDESAVWTRSDSLPGGPASGPVSVSIDGDFILGGVRIFTLHNRHDLRHLGSFQNCFSADSVAETTPGCQPFDLAEDGRVGLNDFERFLGTFAGP